MKHNWSILETKKEFEEAKKRFEEIDEAKKGSPEFKELLLLALLIQLF